MVTAPVGDGHAYLEHLWHKASHLLEQLHSYVSLGRSTTPGSPPSITSSLTSPFISREVARLLLFCDFLINLVRNASSYVTVLPCHRHDAPSPRLELESSITCIASSSPVNANRILILPFITSKFRDPLLPLITYTRPERLAMHDLMRSVSHSGIFPVKALCNESFIMKSNIIRSTHSSLTTT